MYSMNGSGRSSFRPQRSNTAGIGIIALAIAFGVVCLNGWLLMLAVGVAVHDDQGLALAAGFGQACGARVPDVFGSAPGPGCGDTEPQVPVPAIGDGECIHG